MAVAIAGGLVWWSTQGGQKAIVVGKTDRTTSTPLPAPTVIVEETTTTAPPPPETTRPPSSGSGLAPAVGLKIANGRPYGDPIPFRSSIDVPTELQFVLVIGSDARPGQDVASQRADSIHLLAVNPATRSGTIVGIPRDSWVEIPGRGRSKINDSLARGGPKLVAETVRRLTGLPVHYYVLTGFAGLPALVDDLGGVDVYVERRMNDRDSGARFTAGWHHFNGAEALAYSRDRHDVPGGDFGRSENHGNLMLAALGKMRSEVADDGGIDLWLSVLRRHVQLDVPAGELPRLAALARSIDPTAIANVVLPGRAGSARGASVVYLTADAPRLFDDLRDDALANSSVTTTTTTAAPEPDPVTTTTSAAPAG